jgi:xanthine dehydrogenase small subunit
VLEGRAWNEQTVEEAATVLASEGNPIDDQRASAAYRSAMLGNALRAWWTESAEREVAR